MEHAITLPENSGYSAIIVHWVKKIEIISCFALYLNDGKNVSPVQGNFIQMSCQN